MRNIKWNPNLSTSLDRNKNNNNDRVMNKSKEPPSKENTLPSPEEMLQRNSINNGTFGHIAIVDETESYYHQAGGDHVVNCLVVADLEFQGEERLAEAEDFL